MSPGRRRGGMASLVMGTSQFHPRRPRAPTHQERRARSPNRWKRRGAAASRAPLDAVVPSSSSAAAQGEATPEAKPREEACGGQPCQGDAAVHPEVSPHATPSHTHKQTEHKHQPHHHSHPESHKSKPPSP
ncbi:hypothetical protein DACRYDRAFT_97432 [Dacryopinax primogenitus]|uniref:Uncharacterized protein n=1 Tax=Dacryopinax primogenitus (strain DJM 731) TaxID=1858805 RepID=M5FN94_DACPD|nr:uncharacterized protein DACRYDRAFT_97432 [Dacryopinax primogenitus]EJT97050.1 hypothetical protein DACRYDRAFT_97432 [Dacryopinax primogenitus]